MRTLEYGPTISGEFYQFVHNLCETELGVSMEAGTSVRWIAPPDSFAGYLALNTVNFRLDPDGQPFRISRFCLLLDDGDTSLTLESPDAQLDDDPFTRAIFEDARQIFEEHSHEICLAKAEEQERLRKASVTPLYRLRALNGEVLKP